MIDLVLYHFPGACSQVAVCALEWAGLPYRTELINLATGEQSGAEYLKVSPLGKIPMLIVDGVPLAENAAILTFIAASAPAAGLFPADPTPFMAAEAVGGMSFCGGTLHPQVRGIANPARLTAGDVEGVRTHSKYLLAKSLTYANQRLADRGWWLGPVSIVDVYLNWAVSVARRNGFDLTPYPHVDALPDKLRAALPAFAAMEADDKSARAALRLAA